MAECQPGRKVRQADTLGIQLETRQVKKRTKIKGKVESDTTDHIFPVT